MKSFKNHLSLVIALVSILMTIQIFNIVERSIDAYKDKLTKNYSLVVVSQNKLVEKELQLKMPLIASLVELSADNVIKKLNTKISKSNLELLKVTLPKFYKIKLKSYPTPNEIQNLTKKLLNYKDISKVESFSATHDTIYNLLLLFRTVITVLAFSILVVTLLLIFKEMRIWQFKHNERMSIMSLFGAPTWLRSAVLFRLAIVDALIASFVAFVVFSYIASSSWVSEQLKTIGIQVELFNVVHDSLTALLVSIVVSTMLATFIVLGHKEEV